MKWRLLLGLIISAGCVPLLVSHLSFAQVGTALQSARYVFLVPALLSLAITNLIRVWRWYYILAPIKLVPPMQLLAAMFIALLANMLLPAHAGEVIRVYLMRRNAHVQGMVILATLVIERVADLVSIVFLVGVLLVSENLPLEQLLGLRNLRVGAYIAVLLCASSIGGLWLLTARTPQVVRQLRHALVFLPPRWLNRLSAELEAFAMGLRALACARLPGIILGLSFLQWGSVALNNIFILRAFALQPPLTAVGVIMIMEIIGVVLPSAPGYIGTYHTAVAAGLVVFGVPQAQALSVAIVMHAAFFFPGTLVGGLFLWRESLSLRQLWAVKSHELDHSP